MPNPQTITVPIRTVSEANSREHHHKKAARAREQRRAVGYQLHVVRTLAPPCADTYRVDLVRIAPRQLDDDNLARALKSCRDEIAKWLGYDDAPSSPITWRYSQRKGEPKQYAVEITITADPEACPTCGRI
jgi:hypothetical protein